MYIVLLRGINVGGHNKLPMAEFVGILTGLGASGVKTYIQSGNAVMRGDVSAEAIAGAIEKAKGFRPKVMVLPLADFKAIAAGNPFHVARSEGKTLHIWFLAKPAEFDDSHAARLMIASEQYHVTNHAIYLHAPDGIGRSKLAAAMEKLANVPATARNWNTVAKLLDLAEA
ncbi:MAG: DUF1697 domain-containing protein [Paracoccaceae bacterium]